MARITRKTIQTVKDTVKISDVFEWLGTTVVTRGHNTMAFCPFCEDANSRNPGCSLDDNRGLFHCFVCHSSGDLISAVQQHEECSFPEAVELLAAQFNIPVEYDESADPAAESRRKKLVSVLEAAQEEFLAQREDPHFEQFLTERNITREAAEKFELGLSLYTKADEVTARLEEQFGRQPLVDSGLCFVSDDGSLVLRFKNRLTFPIRTAPGTLVAFGGRDLTGRAQAKYKNSPESEIFKKRNVMYGMNIAKRFMSKTKRAIVCEGYMDTIALQSHGFEYTVGAMGTALTAYNLNRLATFADTIYIATDSDQAGIAAAMRTAETIPVNFTSQVRVLAIPEVLCHDEEEVRKTSKNKAEEYLWTKDELGNRVPVTFPVMVPMAKDPDEFFNQVGHTPAEFEKIIEESRDIFLFCAMTITRPYVEIIDAQINNQTADAAVIAKAKMDAKREVSKWLSKVYHKTNIYQRQNISNYMIEALRLVDTFEQMENEWRQNSTRTVGGYGYQQEQQSQQSQQPVFNSAKTQEEDLLIATLYFHPESRKVIKENIENIESVFTSDVRRSVFDKINAAYGKGLSSKEASNDFDENETRELARIVMAEEAKGDASNDLSPETIADICRKVETHAIENLIEQESQSANPDIMKIVSMKVKLAEMQK